jgi:hypothetical protein
MSLFGNDQQRVFRAPRVHQRCSPHHLSQSLFSRQSPSSNRFRYSPHRANHPPHHSLTRGKPTKAEGRRVKTVLSESFLPSALTFRDGRHRQASGEKEQRAVYCTATNAAEAWGLGTGRPSSINPFTWSSIASCIRCSVSSRVFPVATQPGRSGEYAE